MTQRHPLAALTLLCSLVFGVAILWAHPPFLADDYWLLWLPLNSPHYAWTQPYFFSRMPVSTSIFNVLLKLGLWEMAKPELMTVGFALHSVAFGLLLDQLLSRAGVRERAKRFVLIATLFCFNPDNFEIHLWPLLSTDTVAELFLALAFRFRAWPLQVALTSLALLTYDSFLFLLIGYSALLTFLTWIRARKPDGEMERFREELWRRILVIACSVACWIATKLILSHLTGNLQVPDLEKSPSVALRNLERVWRTMWLIHFHRANWLSTPLQWIGALWLIIGVGRNRQLKWGELLLWILIPVSCAVPLCLNTYDAPRAYYGAQLTQSLALAFLAFRYLSLPNPTWRRWSPIALIGIAYLAQWGITLKVKHGNYEALQAEELRLTGQMAACQSPCVLQILQPGQGVENDWVLPPWIWDSYLDRLRLLHFPDKQVKFEYPR